MKDSYYNALKLKATICPEQVRWPTNFTHWQKLSGAVDEARTRAAKALAAMDAVDVDANLSDEGKRSARTKLAEQAVADFHKSNALENARAAVSYMQQRWASKVNEVIKIAEDARTVALHAEIRGRVAALSKEDRFAFLQKHGDDLLVASALLTAPSFLSNVTETEAAMIRAKMERIALAPEVIEAKDATTKAMASAERGWRAAIALVAERGGLPLIKAAA